MLFRSVRRVWKEAYSDVLIQGKLHPGVSICETVIHKPIYFGQKDLSKTGAGFEKALVDKLLGSKLNEIRHEIAQQKRIVAEAIDRLTKITNVQDQIVEQRKIKQDAEHCLTFYAEHGLEQKLQKRLDYDNDVKIMRKGVELTEHFISDLEIFLAQHEDDMRNYVGYHSKHNAKLFEEFYAQYHTYIALIDQVKTWLNNIKASKQSLVQCQLDMDEIRKGMVEEFAEIERKLGDELKSRGSQNISSDDFLILKRKLNTATQAVAALEKQSDQKKAFENTLDRKSTR